jgi:death-on-curing protein
MTSRVHEVRLPYADGGEPESRFLALDDVIHLHQLLIERFGGDPGILSPAALDAAVAQPRMTAFGQLIHPGLIDQAGAYLFHLVAGHPFCDGNKRIGLFAAQVFLRDNGAQILGCSDDWYELTMAVARGELTKRKLTTRLQSLVSRPA